MKRLKKSTLRSYRFSRNTQAILARLQKRTKRTQNIVVQKALKLYEEQLNNDKPRESMVDRAIAGETEYDKLVESIREIVGGQY